MVAGSGAVAAQLPSGLRASGLRALKASDPLPKLDASEVLLLAGKPGEKVVLTGGDGKRPAQYPLAVTFDATGTPSFK